ncbi:hypothetical protein AVEN_85044-1 [Araneus ventricosus]|uniref:Uncharacterized protein n=1 Tax=Araneus ventricosus TaxID=182803 RepID=A0A4Y2MZG7_ARAVE|nr:hypothetical protein AVEN_85044-1 [Araneus ventricosus]
MRVVERACGLLREHSNHSTHSDADAALMLRSILICIKRSGNFAKIDIPSLTNRYKSDAISGGEVETPSKRLKINPTLDQKIDEDFTQQQ